MNTKPASISVLIGSLALMVITYFNKSLLNSCFSEVSFYCVLALFVCWVIVTASYFLKTGFALRLFAVTYWKGVVFSLILSGIVFAGARPYFRVLSDETNLLAVSKSMLYEKRVDNATIGQWYYYDYHPLLRENEKRPFLFPFLTYVIHATTGYRVSNPFVLNFALFFLLLSLIFVYIKGRFGAPYAYSAVLLVAAQPVISQTAASGGFDLLMVVFVFISFVCLRAYLTDSNENSFSLLWINLLMLSNTRYDGLLFMVIAIAALFILKRLKLSYLSSGLVFITPFLMLPVFWQRICLRTNFENPPAVSVFSVPNVIYHSGLFLKTLFDFSFYYPYATLINILGAVSAVYFAYLAVLEHWPDGRNGRDLALITVLCFAGYWITVTSYYFGDPLHPTSSRFFSLTAMALSLLCVMSLERAFVFNKIKLLAPAAAAALFLLYNPVSITNSFSNTLFLPREYRQETDFFKALGTNNIMIIAGRPGQFTVDNFSSVDFNYVRINPAFIPAELDNHLYQHIYAMQEIKYKTQNTFPGEELPASFDLSTVLEFQNTQESFIRISEILPAGSKVILPGRKAKEKTGK